MIVTASLAGAFYYLSKSTVSAAYCSTLHSELARRQLHDWYSHVPYVEANGTKHTPYTTVNQNGTIATVTVGNGDVEGGVYHPMVASDDPNIVHWITHMYVMDQNDEIIAMKTMSPTTSDPATFSFEIPEDVASLTAYAFCNLHGLWKGPVVNIDSVLESSIVLRDTCRKDDSSISTYESWHADFLRRQSRPPFEHDAPYIADGKHTPYITVDGAKGQVVVGVKGNLHVMDGVEKVNEPHWITNIYVIDQNGTIIAFEAMDPTNVDNATMHFDVPESATEVTAYEWCNIHGLWQGPTANISRISQISLSPEPASSACPNSRHDWINTLSIFAFGIAVHLII